ncbi:CGNR zinc finger domain-containing protein [Actinophytocola sp. S1-96]|uniref:CGNR zinc finger domain-containing protein n=1 Tax=Actinophytocola gossypii TaxID=2812003 RepID=A0ABT2JBJ8_9PSEU|nr:CGNR zinc finger domain-containing protein [Actinophytocola gossypii]
MATGLVNTSPVVRGAGEVLTDPAALDRFLADHGLRSGAVRASDDLARVHALRDEIRAVLEAAEDDAARRATELVARAGVGPGLHRDTAGRWQWHVVTAPHVSLADELAVLTGTGLLGVLHALSYDRFRHCAAPGCNGMFVDTSRAGRRRFCMPDLCGNRLNVSNHRSRRRKAT